MNTRQSFNKIRSLIQHIKGTFPLPELPSLHIGTRTARLPIVQGGMGVGISLSRLASAVAEQGGIGTIAANGIGMIEPDYFKDGRAANIRALKKEIRKAKDNTKGIIGVNIMVALQDFFELLHTAIEEKVDMIMMGAGLPVKNIPVKKMREHNVLAVPIVSSSRAAQLIFKMWQRIYNDIPDAVIVEGPEAGGHLGFSENELTNPEHALNRLVPQVAQTLKSFEQTYDRHIPIIAAGGIFTGADIHSMLKLGADAVQMGTRFVATQECDADIQFKQAYISSKKEDIQIIKSPVGLPGRAVMNSFLKNAALRRRTFTCPWQCLTGCRADEAWYCISLALNNARQGNLERGFAFAGSSAYRVQSIVSVKDLLQELTTSYKTSVVIESIRKNLDFSRCIKPLLPKPKPAGI